MQHFGTNKFSDRHEHKFMVNVVNKLYHKMVIIRVSRKHIFITLHSFIKKKVGLQTMSKMYIRKEFVVNPE